MKSAYRIDCTIPARNDVMRMYSQWKILCYYTLTSGICKIYGKVPGKGCNGLLCSTRPLILLS